jgi:hypothetical protein
MIRCGIRGLEQAFPQVRHPGFAGGGRNYQAHRAHFSFSTVFE